MPFLNVPMMYMPEPITTAYLTVVVCWAPRQLVEVQIDWAPGLCISHALDLALQGGAPTPALQEQLKAIPLHATVWGKRVPAGYALQALDRLEFTRALRVDPKIARRERFHKQGSRGAGLFTLKRK